VGLTTGFFVLPDKVDP